MKPLFLLLIFLSSILAHAGSADAIISGKSASGRTALELHVQDIGGMVNFAKVTIDGKSYTLKEGKDTVVDDLKHGVYVVVFESSEKIIRLWMIPKSHKTIKEASGVYHSRFQAILECSDPRKTDKWSFAPRITLNCTLKWEI